MEVTATGQTVTTYRYVDWLIMALTLYHPTKKSIRLSPTVKQANIPTLYDYISQVHQPNYVHRDPTHQGLAIGKGVNNGVTKPSTAHEYNQP